tara:strand:+ start:64591 stop:64704 length:114 start_codon:yes stop_codon:yes gene_type:complete
MRKKLERKKKKKDDKRHPKNNQFLNAMKLLSKDEDDT